MPQAESPGTEILPSEAGGSYVMLKYFTPMLAQTPLCAKITA